jgi:uncharacterized protein (TIGR02996 family)
VREQLIAAIEEDPDDIENYRVYADWLEANNQPRGQLITMELLRARLTDRAKLAHLTRRINEYFQRHRATFTAGLQSWGSISYDHSYGELRWRHGFIHTALLRRYTESDPIAQLTQLVASPSGRFLVGVELHATAGAEVLATLLEKRPATLRRLVIGSQELDVSAAWPRLSRLAHLGVHAHQVELGTIELPTLETATIWHSYIGALAAARIPKLAALRVESAQDPTALVRLLDTLDAPQLARIELPHANSVGELVRDLSSTRIGRQLVEIDLTSSDLTDADARRWAKNPPPVRLRRVTVAQTQITDVGRRLLREHVAVTVEEDAL